MGQPHSSFILWRHRGAVGGGLNAPLAVLQIRVSQPFRYLGSPPLSSFLVPRIQSTKLS
jgi:hypothetical protein